MSKSMKKLVVTVCASTIIWTAGCTEKPSPHSSSTPVAQATASATPVETPPAQAAEDLGTFADQAVKDKAVELAASHTDKGFPAESKKLKDNGPAFLYLAATAEDEAVRYDALKQVQYSYTTSKDSKTQTTVDENYDKVVLHYLRSADQTELFYALQATKNSLRKDGDPAIIDEIVKVGNTHPEAAGRYAAMASFAYLGRRGEIENVTDLYIKAFGDDPAVASMALYWCRGTFGRTDKAEEVKTAILGTLDSEDPGVRGRGIEALAQEFSKDADLIVEKATPLLKDESPYVRAKAIESIARTNDPRVFELALPLLDDAAEASHRIKFQNIMGKNDGILHSTFGWGRVDGNALKAIETVSKHSKDEEPKLELGKVSHKTKDEDIAREVGVTKKWLAARKG